jgi:hypothetical protein
MTVILILVQIEMSISFFFHLIFRLNISLMYKTITLPAVVKYGL